MDTILTYGALAVQVALMVLGGLVVALIAIAPKTKTDLDDKALAKVQWLVAALRSVGGALASRLPQKPGPR